MLAEMGFPVERLDDFGGQEAGAERHGGESASEPGKLPGNVSHRRTDAVLL
jgi:hypothetical protein